VYLFALMAGCGAHGPEAPGSIPADDTAGIDPAWILGPEQPCTAPRDTPSWTDTSGTVTPYVGTDLGPKIGGIALVEEGAERWMVWGSPDAPPVARNLSTGEERSLASLHIAGSFAVADLDGDGAADILGSATARILWDALGDAPELTQLPYFDWHGPSDVAVADFDADGDLDLVYVFQPYDATDPTLGRPFLVRNEGNRTFSEPVPVGGGADRWGEAFDVNTLDLNDDGAPDAYVCQDMGGLVAPDIALLNDGAGNPG
jgi:hypothetical protein